ncbi:MAG: hypothetical protein GWN11_12640 [Candidatus Dadabacteria bacterium]|nr:hypothetical protein [Candidatus Dadabacteria bacterium]NIX16683.1 hypothetical protein [Candidatus Dadabacteria bacterium]
MKFIKTASITPVNLTIILMLCFCIQSCNTDSNSNEITELVSQTSPSYLFVQNAQSGRFDPLPGGDDQYLLTLYDIDDLTTWFTDRPFRKTGVLETGNMLDNFITEGSLPNAALEIPDAKENGDAEVIVFTILGFEYDQQTATVEYEVSIITGETEAIIPRYFSSNNNQNISDAQLLEIADDEFPEEFGNSYLFIDNLTNLEASSTEDLCIEPTPIPIREKYVWGVDRDGKVRETFDFCCTFNTASVVDAPIECGVPPMCRKMGGCRDIFGNPLGGVDNKTGEDRDTCGPGIDCAGSVFEECYLYVNKLYCCLVSPF